MSTFPGMAQDSAKYVCLDLAVLHHLSSLSVLTSHHIAAVLEQFEDLSLRNDPGTVGLLRHLLQHLDQGLG